MRYTINRPKGYFRVSPWGCNMNGMNVWDWIALVLVIIGGLNWGLVGLFDFNLVTFLFAGMPAIARVIFVIVGLAAIWMIVKLFRRKA